MQYFCIKKYKTLLRKFEEDPNKRETHNVHWLEASMYLRCVSLSNWFKDTKKLPSKSQQRYVGMCEHVCICVHAFIHM